MEDREAALLARSCYQSPDEAQESGKRLGFEFEDLSLEESEVYVFSRPDATVVAFRGTDGIADLITDLKVKKRSIKMSGLLNGAKIHRGIDEHLGVVRDFVIDRARMADSPLVYVGHSLGAGVAQVAALEAACAEIKVSAVITFGGMRPGNKSFVRAYNSRLGEVTRRYRQALDPVPNLPPRRWGYRHTLGDLYIDTSGRIRSKIGFWSSAWDFFARLTWRRRWDAKPEFLSAHSMSSYVKAFGR